MNQSQQSQSQQQRIDDLENQLIDLQDVLDFQTAEYQKKVNAYQDELHTLNSEIAEKDAILKELKSKIQTANSNIKEREEYQKTQEESINIAMEAANTKLLELKDNIGYHEQKLDDIKQEILVVDKDLIDFKFTAEIEKNELEKIINELHIERNKHLADTIDAKKKLDKINETYNEKNNTLDSKLAKLEERQTTIEVKYEVLLKEREELEIDKRRFNKEKELFYM